MTHPTLAPRLTGSAVCLTPQLQKESARAHTSSEWALVYPEIERLYLRERRKLRYVVQFMEMEYGFLATEQMYKKRFAKWGFYKSLKKSPEGLQRVAGPDRCRSIGRKSPKRPRNMVTIPAAPRTSQVDGFMHMLFVSVHTWNQSFFEIVQTCRGRPGLQPPQSPRDKLGLEEGKEMNYTLRLVADLLNRGQGKLAGRMARKTFLLLERMLLLEGPVLVWNLLEMMYNLMKVQQTQLFQMLLAHLMALANTRMPNTHPLPAILRALRGFVGSQVDAKGPPVSSSPGIKLWPPTSGDNYNSVKFSADSRILFDDFPTLLHRAWTLNAKGLFDHFDPSLFPLFFRTNWDSCITGLTIPLSGTAKQWLNGNNGKKLQVLNRATLHVCQAEACVGASSCNNEKDKVLAPRKNTSPPYNYEMLRSSSVTALRSCSHLMLSAKVSDPGLQFPFLPHVQALLICAEIFEAAPIPTAHPMDAASGLMEAVPRLYVSHLACMMKTLLQLGIEQDEGGFSGAPMNDVERARAIVAFREYAHGQTDPQVVRDMWLLEDVLKLAGEHTEAKRVRRDVYSRLDMYVKDIPLDSV